MKVTLNIDPERWAQRRKDLTACKSRILRKLESDPRSKWVDGWRAKLRDYDNALAMIDRMERLLGDEVVMAAMRRPGGEADVTIRPPTRHRGA